MHQDTNYNINLSQNKFVESLEPKHFSESPSDIPLKASDNTLLRKTVGQLSWLSSQTRPDIAFDALALSTSLNQATIEEANYSNKVKQNTKK